VSEVGGWVEPDGLDGVPSPSAALSVVGHERTRAAISASLNASRLPSAILLHGPQGIGKATLAFEVARDILSRTGDEPRTRVEEQVRAGAHPNLFVLRRQPKDAKSFYTVIRVDDVRELRERLRKTRGRAGYRVAIIDSIDDCNPSAANALLKTLEEPPAETLFILVSHRPGRLLPTIRSRCHSLAMRPLTDSEVAQVLRQSGTGMSEADLAPSVALAGGRPRRAFEALNLGDATTLEALRNWLRLPAGFPAGAHLELADMLASSASGAEAVFARDVLLDWLAEESQRAATAGLDGRARLASAAELWEKAHTLFAEAEAFNLDPRQTLIMIFDAVRQHCLSLAPALSEPR